MSTKYPQGVITATPPFQSTTAQSFSGVWTLEQLGKNYFYYQQPVAKSLRFRSSASAYLNRTPSTGGNRTTWTWSGWVKRGSLGSTQILFVGGQDANNYTNIYLGGALSDNLELYTTNGGANVGYYYTPSLFRDPSAWYHIVYSVDTTASTKVNIYVNGVLQPLTISTAMSASYNTWINSANGHKIGNNQTPGQYFDGYLAEVNFIDGQALDPSYFGQLSTITGVWAPKKYVGSYGGNGFYLPFTDATSTTTLGYDASGNGNNWTTNNISLTSGVTYDSMWDSPTSYDNGVNGVGNYAVLNPVNRTAATLSNANLTASVPAVNESVVSSMGMTSGKWYAEFTATTVANFSTVGVCNQSYVAYGNSPGNDYGGNSTGYNNTTGKVRTAFTDTVYGNSYTTGDVIGIAVDITNNKLFFAINGTWQNSGNPVTGTNPATSMALNVGQIFFVAGVSTGSGSGTWTANFGQRPFAYTPPTGFKALNTQNLPAVSIANGANHMAASLFTGNNQPNESVLNSYNSVGFQPDFVWMKSRSNSQSNYLVDSVRGGSSLLRSDTTGAESTGSVWIQSFDASGFTATNNVLSNGYTYVGWNWKAGGTAVTNTAGSITSSVSANPTAGFSVVTFTNVPTANSPYTVGHGLGVAPSFYIIKARSYVGNWDCYHSALGNNADIRLNLTNAVVTPYGGWQNTSPTSSVFTINGSYFSTSTSDTFVAYCFAAIPGYSAFGSYTGNGSTDGPFVYCGFRPRFVMVKMSSGVEVWAILDTARDTYNVAYKRLLPNSSSAENTGDANVMDILSNGFKLRSTDTTSNGNGSTYIYACFAENPFKYSLAR